MNGEFKDGRHTFIVNKGKIDNVIYNGNVWKNKIFQNRKPSLIKRVGGKIVGTVANVGRKVFNAAKMAAGAFLMASHFIGKKVV